MAKESKREGGGIGELLAYAGDRKFLTYLGMPHAIPCTQAFLTGALVSSLMPAVPSRKPPPTSRVLNVDFFMLLLPFAALDAARCLSTRVNKFARAHFWKIV